MKNGPSQIKYFIYNGHDTSITQFDGEKFIIHDGSKMCGVKHLNGYAHKHPTQHVKRFLGWSQYVLKGSTDYLFKMRGRFDVTANFPQHHPNEPALKLDHHLMHAWCGYAQSPFKTAAIIAYDGGGDINEFLFCGTKETSSPFTDKIYEIERPIWVLPEGLGRAYSHIHALCYKNIDQDERGNSIAWVLDGPGKVMGLSAYGKFNPRFYSDTKRLHQLPQEHGTRISIDDLRRYDFVLWNSIPEEDKCHTFQKFFENEVISYIEKNMSVINDHDNNLIITGGCALNVLVNEKIKKTFPHLKVFVPPNPDDSGLSHGGFCYHNSLKGLPWRIPAVGTPLINPLEELEALVKNRARKTDLNEIANYIDNGKIIGIVNGRCETGPRALGRRSIVCDPSYPEMKDTLNAKVKFREWYRPFAPFVRRENVEKYFSTNSYDNLEFMSYAIDVREEYKQKLSAITHVDGTARVQTVHPDSGIFYDLLGKTKNEVLLNTSFNVQGKPILNDFLEALYILDNTGLDYVVLEHDNSLHLFEPDKENPQAHTFSCIKNGHEWNELGWIGNGHDKRNIYEPGKPFRGLAIKP